MLGISGIARIFEEIEQRLIKSLKRNLGRHKQEEQEYKKNWSSWQAEKLRSLEQFRRENAAIMAEYTEQIDSETRQLMEEQFSEGMNGVDVPPAEPVPDTPAEVVPEPRFFGVDRTKVNKLIDDMTHLEKNAETAVLRMTDDVYRQTVNRVQLAMSTGMPLQKAIDIAVKDFLDQGINCIVYRDGRRVNIADYVRMALRTTATRAKLQGESARLSQLGYDTVIVSKYDMCSKTCQPWQGRPYINDVFVLWDGEIEERGNGELWGKSHYCDKWFPLLSTAIHAGLFHPNCRHTIGKYVEGETKLPEPIDNSEAERRYKLEQQQRALERAIRKAKRKVNGLSDPENIKKARKELQEAQKKLREFIDRVNSEEGVTVLKRDYGKEKSYGAAELTEKEIDDIIIEEMKQVGIVGKIHLTPKGIDTSLLSFDDEHINSRNHNVTKDDALGYIKKAKFSVTRWNGKYENYFSDYGASYVDIERNQIRTAFSSEEYTETVKKALEVLKKYGR